jgi:phthalate 4,5-dioxygenase oxygenase subunit
MNAVGELSRTATRSPFQYLTDTNKGTPAGNLFRCYWHPILPLEDFLSSSAPVPIRLMGEDFVLFPDADRKPVLIDRKCAHRCADLALARVENNGIRCPYHGWLFGRDGSVLEQPGEPERASQPKYKAKSYPLHIAGEAIWAFVGQGAPPVFPDFPALRGSSQHRYTCRWFGNCNWLQASEGNIDPVHTSFLHQIELTDPDMKARWGVFSNAARPEISVEDTSFGIRLNTLRSVEGSDQKSIRITNFVMPNACAVGGFEGDLGPGGMTMLWDVPIDNDHHWRWEFIYHRSGQLDKTKLDAQYQSEKIEGDRLRRERSDLYDQDRTSMDAGYYLGLGECFSVHDVVITQSQGQIHDQGDEHLAMSDIAIVRARRLLDESCRVVAEGGSPRGVQLNSERLCYDDLVVITDEVSPDRTKSDVINQACNDPTFYQPR